jgi:hypothetical protein
MINIVCCVLIFISSDIYFYIHISKMVYTCRSVITLGDTCPFFGSSFLNTCCCGWGVLWYVRSTVKPTHFTQYDIVLPSPSILCRRITIPIFDGGYLFSYIIFVDYFFFNVTKFDWFSKSKILCFTGDN